MISATAQAGEAERQSSSSTKIFRQLLGDIVAGRYPAGQRLPPERELAQTLDTSRATLREALRKLEQSGLVTPRQGSGSKVQPREHWSLRVLPAVIAGGAPNMNLFQLMGDLIAMRRSLCLDLLRIAAPRIKAGDLDAARAAVARAWELRKQPIDFMQEELDVIRGIVRAASFYPAMWLLNDFAEVYIELGRALGMLVAPPENYLETYNAVLDALEQGDVEQAVTRFAEYFDQTDGRFFPQSVGANRGKV